MIEWLSRRLGGKPEEDGDVPEVVPPQGIEEQREEHKASIERSERILRRFHNLESWLVEGGDRRRRNRGRAPERRGSSA